MSTIIYHNPQCATSRNTLAMLKASGESLEVIEYLSTPPSRVRLLELLALMSSRPRDILRRKSTPYDELGLDDPTLSDEQLIDAMVAHPILINRPIVVTDKGILLCRPSERVLELVVDPVTTFTKEDGEVVHYHPPVDNAISFSQLPSIDPQYLQPIDVEALIGPDAARHAPKILILYGSLRERSYSRLVAEEAARLLRWFGCEVQVYNPSGLPLPDDVEASHPKVQELRELSAWSEGMVWVSPERHGAMTGVMKAQIDWIPLALGGVRPTQGKTLAVMQVCGGSQSFNVVNQLRVLGRWMRMVTIPNQSSVPKVYAEFDDDGRMKPSPLYSRIVDVCEELVKFTWLMRGRSTYFTERYSERIESAAAVSRRVNQTTL